ncbi:HAD family hydrolase [Aneurinibacillus aneurinilyticus]|jgi:pyrophosphatase PpaX|uniref:HAD-IA family hydrolase n=2 Tax=Aneurinibacillus aneurinilyticus TaxID=1391 RepID=A0A848CM50_ANEAE|nr:HAD-IA family hydrolase [Aneurinibacillus aneurinilyticus]ERI11062.1 HAD hydrolase, family IA, variant 3 [Aneurinibacillus aneurinilyticus ATCC 12856]MCI1694432.1 HAD-IA family hydrolase [Aneurinibacillus aneurinilyticus]MED0705364.1 HAD-IA family hydrolase [Aneurinibacillus aneurinilyticus]MED0725375.1 HAD-IA family hydrolase [Aneurinibacillus aneurinilyticus]MED0734279.1 HAD-IA family hydrolase [Aneurinibacillus aneurinilyticus]
MNTVLFDLDGTLHNSEKWYIQACCTCIEAIRERELTNKEKDYLVGKPITKILSEWFLGQEKEVLLSFFTHYEMINHQIREYVGVYEMLTELKARGIAMGIVSSKYRRYIVQELHNTRLLPFFDVIVGLDDCKEPKPNPEPLLKAISELYIKPEDCIYIGDQPTDVLAANAAGIECFGALWGEGQKEKLLSASPAGLLQNPEDILVINRIRDNFDSASCSTYIEIT